MQRPPARSRGSCTPQLQRHCPDRPARSAVQRQQPGTPARSAPAPTHARDRGPAPAAQPAGGPDGRCPAAWTRPGRNPRAGRLRPAAATPGVRAAAIRARTDRVAVDRARPARPSAAWLRPNPATRRCSRSPGVARAAGGGPWRPDRVARRQHIRVASRAARGRGAANRVTPARFERATLSVGGDFHCTLDQRLARLLGPAWIHLRSNTPP